MYNDYEIVYLAQEMDENFKEILLKKYYNVLCYKVNKVYSFLRDKGVEYDDVMQEGYLALDEAINNYNQDSKASFNTFLSICIDRKLCSLITKCNRKKDVILNEASSIDFDFDIVLNEVSYVKDPEILLIEEEEYLDRYNSILNMLSFFEGVVFELVANYFSISEICDILSCEKKDIYNCIRRIRNKISKNYHFKCV